jgi:hypothetical protein
MPPAICDECQFDFPDEDWVYCPHCGRPQRFLNVLAARRTTEQDALGRRYDAAMADATRRGCQAEVGRFEREMSRSRIVLNCRIGKLSPIAQGDRDLFATYYQLEELRFTKEPPGGQPNWKVDRPSAETALLGSNRHIAQLHYGALTLDGHGLPHYGECEILLRGNMVEHRSSVFHENTGTFMKAHHYNPPEGFRSDWDGRARLAVAKLADRITADDQFPQLLMRPFPGDPLRDEFVEVQIFSSMTFRTFDSLTVQLDGPKSNKPRKRPRTRTTPTRHKALRDYCALQGVTYQEVSP